MPLGGYSSLGYQHRVTNATMRSFGQTGSSTGGCNRLIGHRRMSQCTTFGSATNRTGLGCSAGGTLPTMPLGRYSGLGYQYSVTNTTMRPFGQTGISTSGCNRLIGHRRMSQCTTFGSATSRTSFRSGTGGGSPTMHIGSKCPCCLAAFYTSRSSRAGTVTVPRGTGVGGGVRFLHSAIAKANLQSGDNAYISAVLAVSNDAAAVVDRTCITIPIVGGAKPPPAIAVVTGISAHTCPHCSGVVTDQHLSRCVACKAIGTIGHLCIT